MAKALEAGVQGETTEITRRLAIGDQDLDPTRALDTSAATRALPSTRVPPPAPLTAREPPPARTAARVERDPKAARRAAARRRWGVFLALIAVIIAVIVVLIALSSTGGGSGAQAPDANNVEQQIQELRDFIEQNTG
jgi:hypothetical protein